MNNRMFANLSEHPLFNNQQQQQLQQSQNQQNHHHHHHPHPHQQQKHHRHQQPQQMLLGVRKSAESIDKVDRIVDSLKSPTFLISNLNKNRAVNMSIDRLENTIDGYLKPMQKVNYKKSWNEENGEEEILFPFPMPKNGLVKSKTDADLTQSVLVDDDLTTTTGSTSSSSAASNSFNSSSTKNRSYINVNDSDFNLNEINERKYELLVDLIRKLEEYLILLEIILEEYYVTLKERQPKILSQQNELEKIFQLISEFFEFVSLTLLPELKFKQEHWQSNQSVQSKMVIDLFFTYLTQIQLYENYIDQFEGLLKYVDVQSPSKIQALVQEIDRVVHQKYGRIVAEMKIEHPLQLTLKSLLIYAQVLPDLVNKFLIAYENFISIDNDEFKYFNEIIPVFNNLATKSVDSIESSKRLDALSCIQKKIGYKFSIMEKKRILLKEGSLVTLSPYLGVIIRIYIILLNDLLIICDDENDQLKPKRPLDVVGMTVSSDVNYFTGNTGVEQQIRHKFSIGQKKKTHFMITPENGFSIDVPCIQKCFRFYARNAQEKAKWFNVLQTVAQANKFETEIDRRNIGKEKPKFMPDKLFQYCFRCKSEFNRLNRKHYCRACGYVFCRVCTKLQSNLDYDMGKRNRVCDICYDFLNKTFRSKPPSIDQLNQRIYNT